MKTGFFSKLLEIGNVNVVGSCRIGASPSAIGPYFLTDKMLQCAQFCIIDCCVIDYSLVAEKTCDGNQVLDWLSWICQKVRINDCQPIFVMIPIRYFVDKPCPFMELYYKLAGEYGCFYLDVRELAGVVSSESGVHPQSLYIDGAHPGEELSCLMATTLDKFMRAALGNIYGQSVVSSNLKQFKVINISDTISQQVERVHYSTSVFEFKGIRLREGQTCVVPIGTAHVDAIMVNAANSGKTIRLSGSVNVDKNLNIQPYGSGVIEARLVPIMKHIADQDGAISLSVISDEAQGAEASLGNRPKCNGSPDIEISDLLIEEGVATVTYDLRSPTSGGSNIYVLAL